jgi:putative two-component system response regulator
MTQPTILIVDDNPDNLTVLGELLCERYRVRAANSGERALELVCQQPLPDLVLLDVMMPDMSGYEVLHRLRSEPLTRHIPVIFVTAMSATEDEETAFELGAVDYLTKPLRPGVMLARVQAHLGLKASRDALDEQRRTLQDEVAGRVHENLLIQDISIRALARLAETRDNETGHHLLRTQAFVHELAQRAAAHPRFSAALDEASILLIAKSAPLHDIGKVGIPDRVLLKPGKLDAQEWAVMKTHSRLGADSIARAVADTREPMDFLRPAIDIALYHHERWDGSGYPEGLAGEAIPLPARLMALADVFDALVSPRVYKRAMDFAEARATMAAQRGLHFDPDLLDIFLAGYERFCEIARSHPDELGPTVLRSRLSEVLPV